MNSSQPPHITMSCKHDILLHLYRCHYTVGIVILWQLVMVNISGVFCCGCNNLHL